MHDIAAADDRYCGLLAWSGFDYPSGSGNQYQGVKYTGAARHYGTIEGTRTLTRPADDLTQARCRLGVRRAGAGALMPLLGGVRYGRVAAGR